MRSRRERANRRERDRPAERSCTNAVRHPKRSALNYFAEHYHRERPHQGLGGELIEGEPAFPQPANGPIRGGVASCSQ